jgi:predicted ester cyclase
MTPEALKSLTAPVQAAFTAGDPAGVWAALRAVMAPEAQVHLCAPFGSGIGPEAFQAALAPLWAALPDLERREMIHLAGTTPEGQEWIGICGNYMGTFTAPWLDIPPTGHLTHMRFHEFFRVEEGRIVEIQAIWDIPEVMMQAGAWPMAPQLGRFLCTPGPATQDGLTASGDGQATMGHVLDMLTALCRYPGNPDPTVMELDRFWHPAFNWYGPAGIGTARGIAGFRNWHQIPFLTAMPDRGLDIGGLHSHWIAEGAYTCETGWPNMRLTLTRDGWLGLPPTGQQITLRSLDFWRMEAGLIRENWVLVDLLDMYAQLGIDVFGRMREFNKVRSLSPLSIPKGYPT